MHVAEGPHDQRDRRTTPILVALGVFALPLLLHGIWNHPPVGLEPRFNLVSFFGAAFVGFTVAILWHPYRARGMVLPATLLAVAAAVVVAIAGAYWGWAFGLAVGLGGGGLFRLRSALLRRSALVLVLVAALAGWAIADDGFTDETNSWILLAVVVACAEIALMRLFRPAFELAVEPIIRLMYRVRARGPALKSLPTTGACLVIANHGCWLDPLFLAKAFPCPLTPMMTSLFYDLPVLRWLLPRVFGTIRVQEKSLKQDIPPEIHEAVAALDRGECVVIFPEGFLQRSADKPLRRFGRGVWQILSARPETPLYSCWIEGGWGSYFSFFGGKPMKNKRPDIRRPITVSVTGPITMEPEILADHLRTRIHLMNVVLAAREHLGLPAIPEFELMPPS